MYLVWIGAAMMVMKWLEIGSFHSLSWWWALAPFAVALLWFECLERLFGRDRKPVEMADFEHRARERVVQTFKASGRR